MFHVLHSDIIILGLVMIIDVKYVFIYYDSYLW